MLLQDLFYGSSPNDFNNFAVSIWFLRGTSNHYVLREFSQFGTLSQHRSNLSSCMSVSSSNVSSSDSKDTSISSAPPPLTLPLSLPLPLPLPLLLPMPLPLHPLFGSGAFSLDPLPLPLPLPLPWAAMAAACCLSCSGEAGSSTRCASGTLMGGAILPCNHRSWHQCHVS